MSTDSAAGTANKSHVLKPLLFVGLLVLAAILGHFFFDLEARMDQLMRLIEGLGFWGPVLFMAGYVAATVLLVPGLIITIAAGALFGLGWGSLYVSLASTLGATLAFLIGRYLARDWVAQKIAKRENFAAVDRAVGKEGWKIVGLTRLSPLFPFNLMNYAFGLTKVHLRDYIVASWIGMMPGTIMYVYIGSAGKAAAAAKEKTPGEWVLFGAGLVATVVVTILITRAARKALRTRIQDREES